MWGNWSPPGVSAYAVHMRLGILSLWAASFSQFRVTSAFLVKEDNSSKGQYSKLRPLSCAIPEAIIIATHYFSLTRNSNDLFRLWNEKTAAFTGGSFLQIIHMSKYLPDMA